jgi:hypothetical protein
MITYLEALFLYSMRGLFPPSPGTPLMIVSRGRKFLLTVAPLVVVRRVLFLVQKGVVAYPPALL